MVSSRWLGHLRCQVRPAPKCRSRSRKQARTGILTRVTAAPDQEPWTSYRRDKGRSGWSFPVSVGEVATALRACGTAVDTLMFHHPYVAPGRGRSEAPLLRLDWLGDDMGDGGRRIGPWLRLSMVVYAVRTGSKASVRALLLPRGLDAAADWAAAAKRSGSLWASADHGWDLDVGPGCDSLVVRIDQQNSTTPLR